jgi:hypothetical protein
MPEATPLWWRADMPESGKTQYLKPPNSKTVEKKGDIYSESMRLVKRYMNPDSMTPNTPEWSDMTILLMNPQATDAARHVFASMIEEDRSGKLLAAAFGDAHKFLGTLFGQNEADIFGQNEADRQMNYHNNEVGRKLGQQLRKRLGRRPTRDEMALYALKNAILTDPPLAILSTSDPRIKVRRLNCSI